ncbi:hypothetical protein CGG90_15375 [Vibrio parahaemolyticus]|nr:hypothetical protein CGI92_14735 [Vibrio parahaemolyticus]TOQ72065.1 hypothetical protein CGG90_15375 [Vibrio parahaemolyticus]
MFECCLKTVGNATELRKYMVMFFTDPMILKSSNTLITPIKMAQKGAFNWLGYTTKAAIIAAFV